MTTQYDFGEAFKPHKICRYFRKYRIRKNFSEIRENLWDDLKSREFVIVELEDTKSFVVIFKHDDQVRVYKKKIYSHRGCRVWTKDQVKEQKAKPEWINETTIELFCCHKMPKTEMDEIVKRHPELEFAFDTDYQMDTEDKDWSPEKEILYIVLMRLHNFDLHHDQLMHEMKTIEKKEKKDYIIPADQLVFENENN